MAKPISEFLGNIVPNENRWKIKLFESWDKIVGDLKGKVAIEKIDGKLLILSVSHPAWAQELLMLSDVLKEKINALFDYDRIEHIRFRTVKFKKYTQNKKAYGVPFDATYSFDGLSLNDLENKKLSQILDPELKSSLKNFCLRCKRGKNEE